MFQGNSGLHWLADIARRCNWSNAATLVIPADAPVAEAWELTAQHCRMSLETLTQEIAESLHLPCARLDVRDPHVHRFLPEKIARRLGVLPLAAVAPATGRCMPLRRTRPPS